MKFFSKNSLEMEKQIVIWNYFPHMILNDTLKRVKKINVNVVCATL